MRNQKQESPNNVQFAKTVEIIRQGFDSKYREKILKEIALREKKNKGRKAEKPFICQKYDDGVIVTL